MEYKFSERLINVKPSAIREISKQIANSDVTSFALGSPNPNLFPYKELKECYGFVLENEYKAALQYGASRGVLPLLEKIIDRVKNYGILANTSEIMMLHGGQQGLELFSKMFFDKDNVLVVENPTFVGKLVASAPYGTKFVFVPLESDGMNIEKLEQALKNNKVKMIYTMPDFQNPTGITTSLEKRKAIYNLAQKYDVLILEDSPYRELRFSGEHIPAIKSFDTDGRVIFLGSFSKIISPALRQGYAIADKKIIEKLELLKMAADSQNSTINMYVVNEFLNRYNIDEHIAKICKVYAEKRTLMVDTLLNNLDERFTITNSLGGLFTWITMPKDFDSKKLLIEKVMPLAKIAYVPGDVFFANKAEYNHARLNFSNAENEKIVSGMKDFAKILMLEK